MDSSALPSRFSPIEISEPALEHEHLRHLTLYSPALRGRGDVSLFLPPGLDPSRRIPLVLLLHGVYGSHWCWFYKGAAHRTALDLIRDQRIRPMLIAAPSDGLRGDGTGYLPGPDQDFERWICEDLAQCIEGLFAPAGADVLLAGLSMGGYGALRLGAKYPERFCGISAHSAITMPAQFREFVRDMSPFQAADQHELDPLYWLDRHQSQLPPLHFDCGQDDALLAGNEALHQELLRRGIQHNFEVFPGDHNWNYWREHVRDSLLFFERVLTEKE
ncbi:MAG TPA: alpha/beta fold hydrolase [Acidobacteriaceae bacterium]|nr:alpha/beta fold hydrolase [Acidobacteriaceae bacterium]